MTDNGILLTCAIADEIINIDPFRFPSHNLPLPPLPFQNPNDVSADQTSADVSVPVCCPQNGWKYNGV